MAAPGGSIGLPSPSPSPGRALGDGTVLVLAGAAAAGAWFARPVPLLPAAIGVGVALACRRPWLLCVAVLLLASSLGDRSWAGMDPASPGDFQGRVTLVSDPVDGLGGVRALVRARGRRLELTAHDGGAGILRSRLAGEQVVVSGRVRPPPPGSDWFAVRHVVGRLDAHRVDPGGAGAPPWRLGNRLRRLLVDGAASLPPDHRSLYTGFVLGDDRDQSPELADDFRGAGLTHLLAVSGENVAFLLMLAGPILRRLGFRGRWLATVAVVSGFALVTRFEPSVLRASAMAAVAVTASCLGREADALRVLALAVTGLVLVDPFLVRAVGFQLSVAASAGIVVLSRRLAAAVPLPRVVAEPLGVTAAAQLGVAPVLVAVFGGVPVVSVPANLAVGWATGPVMMWGLSAGTVAGVVGEPWARWLHRPTGWLVGWIEAVARQSARLPLGEIGLRELAIVLVGLAGVAWGRRGSSRRWTRVGAGALAVGLAVPAVTLRTAVPPVVGVAEGAAVHRGGGATVVVLESARVRADDLLEGLRRAGVLRVDLLAVRGGGPASGTLVSAVAHRWRPAIVLAPVGHRIPGATTPRPGAEFSIGDLTVTVDPTAPVSVASSSRGLIVRVDHGVGRTASPLGSRPTAFIRPAAASLRPVGSAHGRGRLERAPPARPPARERSRCRDPCAGPRSKLALVTSVGGRSKGQRAKRAQAVIDWSRAVPADTSVTLHDDRLWTGHIGTSRRRRVGRRAGRRR